MFLDPALWLGAASLVLIMCSGVGAGVIIIPMMVSLLGIDPLEAVATGSIFGGHYQGVDLGRSAKDDFGQ